MPTHRLYYTDSLLKTFEATVVSAASQSADGRAEVVLDQTAFYPTSGGQPHDLGTLGGFPVVDVVDRDDGEIAHVVQGAPAVGARVRGEIDWPRRFDHMQQHTGQHILSAAFDRLFRIRTVSFHLGAETSTIDLAREVTASEIAEAESAANEILWQDREISIRFASEEEASRLPLRKEPTRTGTLRLVDVSGFDVSACGGTHVPRAGMVGMIAVVASERFKGATRLGFACGGRALRSHGQLRDAVIAATRVVSVTPVELAPALERMQAEVKSLGRMIREQQDRLAGYRGAELRAAGTIRGGLRIVLHEERGADAAALKVLATAVVTDPGVLVVLVGEGQPAPVIIARSADVAVDAGAWLKRAIAALGGRGGGRPEAAQGGLAGSPEQILAFARETLGDA
jgi:alanyl-tRNA synthetase